MYDVEIPIAGGLNISLPRMARVRQSFDRTRVEDVGAAVTAELERPEIASRIRPGARIAVGAGSRGIANLSAAVRAVVAGLEARGAEPFVFPAMGSHGGATAEGQTAVLAGYGVTEAQVGAPVRATMDTVTLGELDDGTPVHMDRLAHEADGVVLVNRIKPHTNFRGVIESGLVKMLVIGMGKISGATVIHGHGMDKFPEVLPVVARHIMARVPFLFGVGLIENAYDETAQVEAVPADRLVAREMELLEQAKARMGRLHFPHIDVLVIDQMGKEVSGAGFDPNITGRNNRFVAGFGDPHVSKIVVLRLSDGTHGNATGLGLADVITRRLFDEIDFAQTYGNIITSTYLDGGAIPIVMPSERDAIRLAVKTVPRVRPVDCRIVRIRDTLTISEIEVSEPLLDQVHAHPDLELLDDPRPWEFDRAGDLAAIESIYGH